MKYLLVCFVGLALSGCGLQNQIEDLKNRSDQNEGDIRDLKSRQAVLEGRMLVARGQLIALGDLQTTDRASLAALQAAVTSSLVQIAILQGYNNIVSIKDPCGAQGSFNEVFLKLSSGRYLGSMSDNKNGLNTRFSLLNDGNFITTDGSDCRFTISGGGTVFLNEHN